MSERKEVEIQTVGTDDGLLGRLQANTAKPFRQITRLDLEGRHPVTVSGTVDPGAMANILDEATYERNRAQLQPLRPSTRVFSMANGVRVASKGCWSGNVDVGGIQRRSELEVFPAHGAFEVLIGKPFLQQAEAVQDYKHDTIEGTGDDGKRIIIQNSRLAPRPDPATTSNRYEVLAIDDNLEPQSQDPVEEQNAAPSHAQTTEPADSRATPEGEAGKLTKTARKQRRRRAREHAQRTERAFMEAYLQALVSGEPWESDSEASNATTTADSESGSESDRERGSELSDEEEATERALPIVAVGEQPNSSRLPRLRRLREEVGSILGNSQAAEVTDEQLGNQIHVVEPTFPQSNRYEQSGRVRDPFCPDRVEDIRRRISVGPDLTEDQRRRVFKLVTEYADIFALSLSEVLPVDFIKHKLRVDKDVKLPTRVHQKPLTDAQKEWWMPVLDEMEASGICARVPADYVRCVSSTNLPPKDAGGTGLTRDEIIERINVICKEAGFPPYWERVMMEGDTGIVDSEGSPEARPTAPEPKAQTKPKWRVCHAFMALNKATQVPPFPQGDLLMKQQRMAGKRWTSVVDFASGYYAIPMDEDAIPYTAFYVEGRGYYVYLRMPFGLTGAPTTFCEMVSMALDEMIGRELENWVDDVCISGDDFEGKMAQMAKFFGRCREKKLSLAPAKCKLFQSEVSFAGAILSARGVGPNSKKIAPILEWPRPINTLQLMGFLGLTNTFRRVIPNYAAIAAPLTDLTRDIQRGLDCSQGIVRQRKSYKQLLQNEAIGAKWGEREEKAFVHLKCLVTENPVLRSPVYDGRPFRVVSDGAKVGFGAVLEQEFEYAGPGGQAICRWHPIAFASKRASKTEEKYIPFLSEFAALKFALDEFRPYIFGSPIVIETDCQALRDLLLKDHLGATHARWRDAILAHNIVDVRHRPGKLNKVADALSRKFEQHEFDSNADQEQQWTVSPDWEAVIGIPNDIQMVGTETSIEHSDLRKRFGSDPYFKDIVDWLETGGANMELKQRNRIKHRATGFMIGEGKLWRVGGKNAKRAPKVECLTAVEGRIRAKQTYERGHFGQRQVQMQLMDSFFWPGLSRDATEAVIQCGRCKNFGATKLNALLEPITRRRPFELIAGDYLSLPEGKGGYKTVGLYIDVCSQRVWAFKHKNPGTAKMTIDALDHIRLHFAKPRTFMADGGTHFTAGEVADYCAQHQIQRWTTPAYSPWVNGLIENANKILIGRLKRRCAPNLNLDDLDEMDAAKEMRKWPEYLDEEIAAMNDRILHAVGYTPREIMMGLVREDEVQSITGKELEKQPPTDKDIQIHMALAEAQRDDADGRAFEHAAQRKAAFDEGVREIIFNVGDLVQVYDNRLDNTFETKKKLLPRWSPPVVVLRRVVNSYEVGMREGHALKGRVHARRLRKFHLHQES